MSDEIHAFTIASYNYLPQVEALRESFLRHHPSARFYVFLCDLLDGRPLASGLSPNEMIEVGNVVIPKFEKMCFVYNLTELNTAIKPFCFLHMFEKLKPGFCFYIDPDIYFYSPMKECLNLVAENADIILTPHTTEPIEDIDSPNDYDFAKAGIYNLGFCGIRNSNDGRKFAAWWARKLEDDCRVDLQNGIFVDQKWCDAAPALFDKVAVLRHQGYNVAYWNMMHRPITVDAEGHYLAGRLPLRFFHFSGVSMFDYRVLSKYQKRLNYDNIGPYGQKLLTEYRIRLMHLQYFNFCSEPFLMLPRFRFNDPAVTRDYARAQQKLLAISGGEARLPSMDDFWSGALLTRGVPEHLPIPDFLICIYEMREDIQRLCGPLNCDDNIRNYMLWARSTLLKEMPFAHNMHVLTVVMWDALAKEYFNEGSARVFSEVCASYCAPSPENCSNDAGVPLPYFVEAYMQTRPDLAQAFDLKSRKGRRQAQAWFTRHFEDEMGATDATRRLVYFVKQLQGSTKSFIDFVKKLRDPHLGGSPRTDEAVAKPSNSWRSRALIDFGKRTADTFEMYHHQGGYLVESLKPGITLVGYPRARMGMGVHVRNTAHILDTQNVDYEIFSFDAGLRCDNFDASFDHKITQTPTRRINIFHVNADQTALAKTIFGPAIFDGRYNIGYWAWELEVFPDEFLPAIEAMDELWAPSKFVQMALRRRTSKPVLTIPLCVEVDKAAAAKRYPLPRDVFCFLFFFDFDSFHQRKNPWALLDTFSRAFPISARDDVQLIIKTIGHERHNDSFRKLQVAAAKDPRISLIAEVLSSSMMTSLLATASCFVSLHRSEGFGRGMAEAMSLGKPVIATGYSGNLDFMTPDNSYLVDCQLIDVGATEYAYPCGARWASPSVQHAAKLMRDVFENQAEAAARGRRAQIDIAANHSSAAVAAKIMGRLDQLGIGVPPPSALNRPAPGVTTIVSETGERLLPAIDPA